MTRVVHLVTYQLPYDRIVGIFECSTDALIKYDSIPATKAPLMYQCPIDRVETQNGYRKNLKLHRKP